MPEMSAARRGQGAGRGRLLNPTLHEYGPHREEENPRTVTVWRTEKAKDGTEKRPIAQSLIAQRRRVNDIAYEQARARAEVVVSDTPGDG